MIKSTTTCDAARTTCGSSGAILVRGVKTLQAVSYLNILVLILINRLVFFIAETSRHPAKCMRDAQYAKTGGINSARRESQRKKVNNLCVPLRPLRLCVRNHGKQKHNIYFGKRH